MPAKTTDAGRKYEVDGKTLTWTTDEGQQVTVPLRLKLKVIRSMGAEDLNPDTMFALLEKIIPDQAEVLDEMDLNDFQEMFKTWQSEYAALSGATLGESQGSSPS